MSFAPLINFKIKNTVPQRTDNTQLGTSVSNIFFKYPNLVPINNTTGSIDNFKFITSTGSNLTCSDLNVISDYDSSVDAEQFTIQGETNPNNKLYFGYQTSLDYSSIQSRTQGISFRPIMLNPLGGNVAINTSSTSSIGSNALYVNGNIFASGTITPSDIRVKKNITDTSSKSVLELLNKIELKKYNLIDSKDDSINYGVIAQQIKDIIPEAVTKMTMVIPSVMQESISLIIDTNYSPLLYNLTLENPHNLTDGCKVRIINQFDNTGKLYSFSEDVICNVLSDKILSVKLQNKEFKNYNSLFVYGVEVDDFLAIDKSKLFMPLIGAVQELTNMITYQNEKISNFDYLNLENLNLKKTNENENHIKTQIQMQNQIEIDKIKNKLDTINDIIKVIPDKNNDDIYIEKILLLEKKIQNQIEIEIDNVKKVIPDKNNDDIYMEKLLLLEKKINELKLMCIDLSLRTENLEEYIDKR